MHVKGSPSALTQSPTCTTRTTSSIQTVTSPFLIPCAAQWSDTSVALLSCRYIETFQSGFDAGLKSVPVYFMQSDGGLADVSEFSGHKAILSGPAGTSKS